MTPAPATVIEILRRRAAIEPGAIAFRFLGDDGAETAALTVGTLARRVDAVAATLLAEAERGDRALLLYPSGPGFLAAFLGCLAAGVIAVPLVPPRHQRHLSRLTATAQAADSRLVLTGSAEATCLARWLADDAGPAWQILSTDRAEEAPLDLAPPQPADIAYLQFTSGSTSAPKGVMVSHGNLVANSNDMRLALGLTRDSIGVTWMPHFHDMGLIEGLMVPLVTGFPTHVMAPLTFLQHPHLWLAAISRHRATTSAGPNFAFDLCVERIGPEQRAGLDLSSWRTAVVGAEPVRSETLRHFVKTFAPHGFCETVPRPGYGLAEATLMVSLGPSDVLATMINVDAAELARGRVRRDPPPPAHRFTLVEAGRIGASTHCIIVDPGTACPCPPDVVGEIWVRGAGIGQGYWRNPAASAETFGARLEADDGHCYLATGDLGFLASDGKLFITGRRKDVIIVAGANHYPQDIEATAAAAHPDLKPGAGAAFMLTADDRALCIAFEARRTRRHALDIEALYQAVAQAVADIHDLAVDRLVLLQPGTIPKTTSGKIQRSACRALIAQPDAPIIAERRREAPPVHRDATQPAGVIADFLIDWVARRCGLPPAAIDPRRPFAEFGLVSRDAVALSGALGDHLGRPLPPSLAYDHPSIAAVEAFITNTAAPAEAVRKKPAAADAGPIAIIGMACRLPGADDPQALWQLLIEGRDALSPVPPDRWVPQDGEPRRGGFLAQVDRFDADFFAIAPREAELMDPQQRLMLELAWEALEEAQIPPERLAGSDCGVFVGISTSDYAELAASLADGARAHAGTGNALAVAANRLSYALDLRGPSLAVDTACSSALVALHQACMSLRRGECGVALCGAVNLMLTPRLTRVFAAAGMLAPDGCCKTFDAAADGYARGEGGGVVVLKPLAAARADGDRVLAVIRGSAVNQDGRSNGLTAPNGEAQRAVIASALRSAGVAPADVHCVEAHGTGTPLGDPIEVAALAAVLGEGRPADRPCVIGSIKPNIGHLEAAAGIAGLIKTVLALSARALPPQAHFSALNPAITLNAAPLRIVTRRREPLPAGPLIAGVSSFGFGGTNAHAVIASAEPAATPESAQPQGLPQQVLALSARSPAALRALAERHAALSRTLPAAALTDLCRGAVLGRSCFEHRLAVVAETPEQTAADLSRFAAGDGDLPPALRHGRAGRPRVAFLITGQGAQFAGMGRALADAMPPFRAALAQCEDVLRPHLSVPLSEILADRDTPGRLDRTLFAQPALFAIGYASALTWRACGIAQELMLGHSVGEYVAACLAGVFDLPDALRLIAARARLMDGLTTSGAMIAVAAPAATASAVIDDLADRVALAADNAADACVLSGDTAAVMTVADRLAQQGIAVQRLRVSHAFHSPLMDPILSAFAEEAARVTFRPPQRPFISNLTGAPAGAEVASQNYWVQHLRQPVRFAAGIRSLATHGIDTLIELGPRPVLLALASSGMDPQPLLLATARPDDGARSFADSLAALHVAGAPVDWQAIHGDQPRRHVALPTYPFERRRFWLSGKPATTATAPGHPLLGEALDLAPEGGLTIFSTVLDRNRLPYLDDHRIENATVFPATGYIEMAFAAGAQALGSNVQGPAGMAIGPLTFFQPMVFAPDMARRVETRIMAAGEGFTFTIHSRAEGEGEGEREWIRHAAGTLQRAEIAEPALDLAAIRARCPRTIAGADFYTAWRDRGNQWGPAFEGLERLWLGDGEALARIAVPSAIAESLAPYHAHPGLLDTPGQPLAALGAAGDGPFVARGIDRIASAGPWRGPVLWTHAVLDRDAADSRAVTGNLRIADDSGRVIATVHGLTFTFLRAGRGRDPLEFLHRISLVPHRAVAAPPTTWQVIGVGADDLVTALAARGHAASCTTADAPAGGGQIIDLRLFECVGTHTSFDGTRSPRARSFSRRERERAAARDEGLRPVDRPAPPHPGPLPSGEREQRPYPRRSLDSISPPTDQDDSSPCRPNEAERDDEQIVVNLFADLVALVQRLAALPSPPRLWLASPREHRRLSAALAAFGRALAAEHPELFGGIVEIDGTVAASALADSLLGAGAEQRLVVTADGVMVPRLHPFPASAAAMPYAARPDQNYLITGGLGDLGLRVADWLAARGARHLVLLGRSGLPERSAWDQTQGRLRQRIDAVRRLEARGVDVRIVALDLADAAAVAAWQTCEQADGRPPLAGIVHAAGEIARQPLSAIAPPDIAATFAGKAFGAGILASLGNAADLDFCLLFGSASTFIDSPGLALYAAANGWLDGLAAELRDRGVKALSIAWGAFKDIGLAARSGLLDDPRSALSAFGTISPEAGIGLLDHLIPLDASAVAVLPTDWQAVAARFPALAAAPFFAAVMTAPAAIGSGGTAARLRALAAEARAPALIAWLETEVCAVLHRGGEGGVDHNRPLHLLGLDSLMAVELRVRIERALGVVVPVVELVRGPTLRALGDRLLAGLSGADAPPTPAVSPVAPAGPAPLSYGQRAQWLLHQLAPESSAYHISFAARVIGRIAPEAMELALAALIARHAALRTVYALDGGEVRQIERPQGRCDVARIDARDLTPEHLAAAVRADYARPFDLAAGPLLRLRLYDCGTDEQVLLLVAHHIACDGWSLWVLLRDLGALLAGRAAELPTLTRQHVDAVAAEQALLTGPDGDRLWDFWRRRLTDLPSPLPLPADHKRPPVMSHRGASLPILIDAPLTADLRALARDCGATLYVTVLSAFAVLLQRLGGEPELVIGTPTAGRGDPAFTEVVGTFVNPVVLRLDLTGNPSFAALVARNRVTVLEALEHQGLPFPLLVERLRPPRDPSRTPIFQVDFAWQRPHQEGALVSLMTAGDATRRIAWGGHTLAPYPMAQQEGQFDLVLEIAEAPDRLPGSFKYNPDLFDHARIAAMAEQFLVLLRAAVAAPQRAIADLPLAPDPAVPPAFIAGEPLAIDERETVIDRIRAVAAAQPGASAVICGDERVSYGTLLLQAGGLARALAAQGAGCGTRVGLQAGPSAAMIAGMLGIMLAGAAYVPLDPNYPDERLADMIADAGLAAAVICGAPSPALADSGVPLMSMETVTPAEPGATRPAPADAAYLIYTSGSTGRPKGVLVTHANLAWSTGARLAFYHERPQRYLVLSSIAFDSSVAGLFWTLATGGALVLPAGDLAADPLLAVREIRRHAVTHMLCVPSLHALALRHAAAGDLASLRLVIVAGEACRPELVAAHLTALPDAALVNEYGPTECTVWCAAHRCRRDDDLAVPIGRPIPGGRIHILDARGEPAPIGLPGEIFVGGPGVTAGYLGAPALTAARFVPDRFSTTPGNRLYRTGDRGAWRPDGSIDFLGRMDDQIKLRGYRIEPGEIEALLAADAAVREAVVVRRDTAAGPRLAAYVAADGALDEAALLASLRRKLPGSMVPATITRLAALPRSVNGKLDRKALPDPVPARPIAPAAPPRGPVEQAVAAVWRELLGVEPGRDDSFFDLGGHSLLIVECRSALERRLGIGLPIVDLFAQPTVAAIARHIDGLAAGAPAAAPAGRAVERAGQAAALAAQRAERRRARAAAPS
jgi:phthiocerol/phenolphthiocerol synthesis type-I polyketide synthase C